MVPKSSEPATKEVKAATSKPELITWLPIIEPGSGLLIVMVIGYSLLINPPAVFKVITPL